MKSQPLVLLVSVAVWCTLPSMLHADTINVLYTSPAGSLYYVNSPVLIRLQAYVSNPLDQTVYLSDIVQTFGPGIPTPPTTAGSACDVYPPDPSFPTCDAALELPLGSGSSVPYFFDSVAPFYLGPGTYNWSIFVYGGFSGANDFSLLGSDTFSFRVISAVPEPSTLLLLSTGLLGIAGVVRRKMLG